MRLRIRRLLAEGSDVFSFAAGDSVLARDGTLPRLSLLQSRRNAAVFHSGAASVSGGNFWSIHQDPLADSFAPSTV